MLFSISVLNESMYAKYRQKIIKNTIFSKPKTMLFISEDDQFFFILAHSQKVTASFKISIIFSLCINFFLKLDIFLSGLFSFSFYFFLSFFPISHFVSFLPSFFFALIPLFTFSCYNVASFRISFAIFSSNHFHYFS